MRFHDEPLWEHLLITTKVHPQFFAFRWITLLFTHEFDFPHQSLRLWDFILCAGDDHKLVSPHHYECHWLREWEGLERETGSLV